MVSDATAAPRFFVLMRERGGPNDTEFDKVAPNRGKGPDCPKCGTPIGPLEWLPPFRVKLDLYGSALGDFVEGPGSGTLVSQHLADAFREEGLTGLQGFHPVEVVRVRRQRRGPKPSPVPAYFFVTLGFGPAAVDEASSHIKRKQPISCDTCRSSYIDSIHGFSLEAGSWTGEDVFEARGMPGSIIVSERFVHLVQQHGFTNMKFIPTEEYVWDPLGQVVR